MSYRVFRWVAGTFLVVVVGFIGVLALLSAGDSTDSGGVAVTTSASTTTSVTTTTGPATTTTMATTTTRGVRYLTLPEALAVGMVEAEFRGTGSASGDIVTMAIRLVEVVDEIVSLSVPPGMMLTNTAGGEQDLVIRGLTGLMTGESTYRSVMEITLHDVEWREYILEAYCAEAHDDNPSAEGMLTASESPNEELAKVFAAIDELEVDDIYVIQGVVWAITDDIQDWELERIGYGLDETRVAQAREIIAAAGLDPTAFRLFR
jgi:hypothetical protein